MPTHLEEYLAYYSTLNSPGYAVLVTGDWGTGKTYQVKSCIHESDRLYVSLFGVQTIEHLHSEVFAAAAPNMAKAKSMVSEVSKVVSNISGSWALAGVAPGVFNSIFRRHLDSAKTLIFDDLERSDLQLKDILGAINSYVEHLGFRVVVVAHDSKLTKKFRKLKEKIFGQTIRVEPQTDQAFDDFIRKIKDANARFFINKYRDQINNIFHSSGEKSLRILRHVVEDLIRLYGCLKEEHIKNTNAMTELVQIFVAFDTEIRAAGISEKDLKNRNNFELNFEIFAHRNKSEKIDEPKLIKANKKYASIDLEGNMLNDDVLVSMLIEGMYRKEEIQRSIDDSPYFLIPGEASPWRIIMGFDNLEDEIVEAAAKRMEEQFAKREVTNVGEILHIFCLRMMMAENRILDCSVEKIVKQNKKYIDDLLDACRLPPREINPDIFNNFSQAYDGSMYWVSEQNKVFFNEIFDYLNAARQKAFEETVPEILETLLEKVRNDPEAFFEAVSPTNNGPNPYVRVPLLHHIPASDFVDAWLGATPENWKYVNYAMQGRYEAGALERYFEQEKEWAFEVLRELDRRANAEKGFRAFRIKRIRPKLLIEIEKESQVGSIGGEIDDFTGE